MGGGAGSIPRRVPTCKAAAAEYLANPGDPTPRAGRTKALPALPALGVAGLQLRDKRHSL